MSIQFQSPPEYERVQMVLLGLFAAGALFGYGACALLQASCVVVGWGNPPIGTFVTFYGVEARLLSTIYLGSGIWLFAAKFLGPRYSRGKAHVLSWVGAITLLFGMSSLVVILCLPFFR